MKEDLKSWCARGGIEVAQIFWHIQKNYSGFKNLIWPPQLISNDSNSAVFENNELTFCVIVAKNDLKHMLNASDNFKLAARSNFTKS